jgi:large subunit ribosomal protein L13
MKTTFMANASNIERKWYVVDAEGQTLGRLREFDTCNKRKTL